MTVAELLSRISSAELTEWMAFYTLEPFGFERDMLGHAITASTIYNVNRGSKDKALDVEDFMPRFQKIKQQTTEDQVNVASMITKAFGGKDLRE